ncbi:acid phosphatase [Myriangium duriaei CBS 260.36]|uniref:3-phytase n=1 Tax=Myriangium duriaei CBS 260.36 TaxID=1168546 RepID=A0A9P4MF41_9PEZI|nr:acid phosphatase [Myriangium duriaei CBS 260.36]
MTTLKPREPYSESELKRLYPDSLQLEQVQVLLRHGERTPVNARFQNAGLQPYWPYCNAAQRMRSVLLSQSGDWDSMTYRRKLETFDSKDDSATLAKSSGSEAGGICLPGELTDVGRRTTLNLGTRLRDLYIARLQFLPGHLSETTQSQIYIRATPIPRALESVQQTFLGLYPMSSRGPDLSIPSIITRQASDETLFPNEGACKRFRQLAMAFGDRAAQIWNDSPELRYVTSKIGKHMPAESPAVKVDSHPRLSGVMDTINSTLAHGPATKLPAEFYDPKLIANIDRIAVEEWFAGYRESNEYRRLGIGALVGDVTARLVERARAAHHASQGKTNALAPGQDVRFALSGCHDTTLAAILASLGAYDNEPWPPYTSHIAIELLREREPASAGASSPSALRSSFGSPSASLWSRLFPSTSTPTSSRTTLSSFTPNDTAPLQGFYVRLRYNDRVMHVPGCAPEGKHRDGDESLCTLIAFKEVVDKFTPRSWKTECGMNLDKSALPEKSEPAGY